jgi:hypothetical protein
MLQAYVLRFKQHLTIFRRTALEYPHIPITMLAVLHDELESTIRLAPATQVHASSSLKRYSPTYINRAQ